MPKRTPLAVAAACAFALAATGCLQGPAPGEQTGTDTTPGNDTQPIAPCAAPCTVDLQDIAFKPIAVSVKKGESIKFMNKDSVAHTVTPGKNAVAQSDSSLPKSENMSGGADKTLEFTVAGSHDYTCEYHPQMNMTIEVTE